MDQSRHQNFETADAIDQKALSKWAPQAYFWSAHDSNLGPGLTHS